MHRAYGYLLVTLLWPVVALWDRLSGRRPRAGLRDGYAYVRGEGVMPADVEQAGV